MREYMQCEMCGRKSDLEKAVIEGVELGVCRECSSFGTVLRRPRTGEAMQAKHVRWMPRLLPRPAAQEIKERLVPDFAERVRKQRERRGLTQEAFARLLAERESLVQKMEAGAYVPSIDVARKMERILNIQLVEVESGDVIVMPRSVDAKYTLGDFLKRRN